MNQKQPPANDGKNSNPNRVISDGVNFRSQDGLVEVVTKVATANRHPRHDYPIVCIKVRPRPGTRIQKVPGTDDVEMLFTHTEVISHLRALNQADAKSRYTWLEIPEKPAERKAYWDKVNQERRKKLNGGNK